MGTARPFPRPLVVVADDDRETREHVASLLRKRSLAVLTVSSGQKAIDTVRAQPADLVVLDANMPGLSGVDACRVIKTMTEERFVPVVLLAAPGETDARLLSVRSGADDHVAKPFEDEELVARVENMLRIKRSHDDVQFAKDEIRYESLHEKLGALPDHRYFHDCLENEFAEAQRHLDPLACCIVAVDDFRSLVSDHGSEMARSMLEQISGRIQRTVRVTDLAAQFRTAEFGLLLLNTRPARALALADRLISQVALRPFETHGARTNLAVSIGVGLYPTSGIRTHAELLDAASIAVARARVAGPNRVCVVQRQGYLFRPSLLGAA